MNIFQTSCLPNMFLGSGLSSIPVVSVQQVVALGFSDLWELGVLYNFRPGHLGPTTWWWGGWLGIIPPIQLSGWDVLHGNEFIWRSQRLSVSKTHKHIHDFNVMLETVC